MSGKIKIVHVLSNLSLGGAQVLVFDILKNLIKKNDLELSVITIDSGEYKEKYENAGIRVYDLNEKGLINPKIYFKMKKLLLEIKPDIVHTHLNKADFYGRIAAKQTGVKVIFSTCHNYSSHHKGADINKKSMFDRIDDVVISYSKSNLIAISEIVKKYLVNRNRRYEKNTELIYNGLNVDKEKYILNEDELLNLRNEYNYLKSDFIISILGRLDIQKGHDFFIRSVKEFLTENKNVKVLILGDGKLRNDIEKLISDSNLSEQIRLIGFQQDTERFIEMSDLICVPSLWEGFGLVIIEAMIKGKLVLASNTGGIPEIIEDNVNGFLFETADKKDLIKNLDYIYENRNDLDEIRKNAVETVKSKFDIAANSEKYYRLYIDKLKLKKT
ncbi:MAG: glycosyltransferase family 4 protein [Ignavibacteriae bacterium]|nr:glycosyltransferase family 4 protein [Ignavibacteriota bacterium]